PANSSAVLYSGGIAIDSTTFLRASAVKKGFGNSTVIAATYIYIEDVLVQDPQNAIGGPQYPFFWQGNATGDYAIDPRVVATWDDFNPDNNVFGIREALTSLPTMSIVIDHDDLWNATTGIYPNATSEGSSWRRAGSVEHFDPATGESFQHNV